MELKIYAVGSNHFLAEEIRNAVELILGKKIPLCPCLSNEIINCMDGQLYICNRSQYTAINQLIPKNKIVILDLTPTSRFYVSVAAIPRGNDVYIFNNQQAYIETLIHDFKQMGIEGLNFIPLPYSELPQAEVFNMLAKARYIVGVDYLMGENVLQSPPYLDHLHYNVKCISAKRVGSVSSACEIISRVNMFLYQEISVLLRGIFENAQNVEQPESLFEIYKRLQALANNQERKMIMQNGHNTPHKFLLDQIIS